MRRRGSIEILVNAIILSAVKKQARFICVIEGYVHFWIDDQWQHELSPPPAIYPQILRRFGVMLGVLLPPADQSVSGKLTLRVGADRMIYCRLGIERDLALVEIVTQAEQAERVLPVLPARHPYRHRMSTRL